MANDVVTGTVLGLLMAALLWGAVVWFYQYTLRQKTAALEEANAELAQTLATLKNTQAHRDEFMAWVGHELRTPMNAIMGMANLILRHTDDPKTNGCPPDRDHDGILDDQDACPDVAGVASSDANLYAFDARTGAKVWQTVIGDRSNGGSAARSWRPAQVPRRRSWLPHTFVRFATSFARWTSLTPAWSAETCVATQTFRFARTARQSLELEPRPRT